MTTQISTQNVHSIRHGATTKKKRLGSPLTLRTVYNVARTNYITTTTKIGIRTNFQYYSKHRVRIP